jgi:hypothetical protein
MNVTPFSASEKENLAPDDRVRLAGLEVIRGAGHA